MRNLTLTFLAAPLSFVGIPIYVNIADFYARQFQISLIVIGIILAVVRLFDAIQDPIIGKFSDILVQKNIGRKHTISIFGLFLCLFFYLVFNPPQNLNQTLAILWFFVTLSATYFCFNFIFINFESIIALNSRDDEERIKLNSLKEFFGICGMILAFILPTIFAKLGAGQNNYKIFALFFAVFLMLAIFLLAKNDISEAKNQQSLKIKFYEILQDKKFINFIKIFFLNSCAVSLPAANLNFYVKDILQAEEKLGLFLVTYFVSACVFIPFWRFCGDKFSIINSWIISLCGSFLVFCFAYFIDSAAANLFFVICFLSGAFLGADLIYPPVIMAQITANKKEIISSYFAIWNFVTKIGIMAASSISAIALGFFGYQPAAALSAQAIKAIPFFYAILPCILKALVVLALIKFIKNYDRKTEF